MGTGLILFIFLDALILAGQGFVAIGGIIVLAKVWEKIRPVIIAKTEDDQTEYYFGVSHSSKRKNMKKLTQDGIDGLVVNESTVYGLCNKPPEIKAKIGTITQAKANELIDSLPEKKRKKLKKRQKDK